METKNLKVALIRLIGDCIDEKSISGVNSFVEMNSAVIHYSGDGEERYYKVSLEEVDEDMYWEPYQP
jgi:hypothetical protein